MHRLIIGTPDGRATDHKDSDGLNNQRVNLRICDPSQNSSNAVIRSDNTSGFKGVSWRKNRRKWLAQIQHDHRVIHIGQFSTALEAAIAYDEAARKLHGEFARTNLP